MSFDQRCYELAEFWLESDPDLAHLNTEANLQKLAQAIQDAIEDWLGEARRAEQGAQT